MTRIILLALLLLIVSCKTSSNTKDAQLNSIEEKLNNNFIAPSQADGPNLIVGIVIDQMRYDYLTRFDNRFGDDGFKRLVSEGYTFRNNHFNFIPTYTGPGHASIFTGTAPQNHGIISNDWYNKFDDTSVYCVQDNDQKSIGTTSANGQMSPHRMQTTTFCDQNRLHTQMRGKTIGISLKDRGAILPAGHTANAAYWFESGDLGHWISSSYYMDTLPEWVKGFNNSEVAESYITDWNTLYNIDSYTASGTDTNSFEGGFSNNIAATFPYSITKEDKFNKIKPTPYGNSLTADFAIAALEGEELGQDEYTDVLTVSFSSTDYVGHNFGVNSVEVEDTYLRLDQDIARLLRELDRTVGKSRYTVFLTSDHGAVHVPAYLKSVNIPAGYFDVDTFMSNLNDYVAREYKNAKAIKDVSNYQIFFDYDVLKEQDISPEELQNNLKQFILQQDQVYKVYTRQQLESSDYTAGIAHLVQQGYHQKRSGDLVFLLEPNHIRYSKTGSTHGSGLQYDTHVPLIFYGYGIRHGESYRETEIIDIAPTISAMLGISFPNGSTGKVLTEILK